MKYIIVDKNGNPYTHVSEIQIYNTYEAAHNACNKLPQGYSVSLLKESKY